MRKNASAKSSPAIVPTPEERACVRLNYGGAIGFATGQAPIASTVALIDLMAGANGAVDTCCPFLATTP